MSNGHKTSAVPRPRTSPRIRPTRSARADRSDRRGRSAGTRSRRVESWTADWTDDHSQLDHTQLDHTQLDHSWLDQGRLDLTSATGAHRSRSGARSDHTMAGKLGTRPIDDEHQLVTRRPHRLLVGLAGFAVVMAIVAALFVIPFKSWMRQKDEIVDKRQELSVLTEANRKLGNEVDHLATPEGAKEAARDELGVVGPGEDRISILPTQTGALPLPAGWPYDTVLQIVNVRQSAPVVDPAPAP